MMASKENKAYWLGYKEILYISVVFIPGLLHLQKRVGTQVLQAAVILRAGMAEMRVMVVAVMMLVMTGGLPNGKAA
jgi:hypothetical protein